MTAMQQLHSMLGENEDVLWSGKPNLRCFLLEAIFNPLLPFALVWALFDGFFITMLFHKGGPATQEPILPLVLIGFFALHLMPVWIYLGGVLFSYLNYKHTAFLITNKNVYISGGLFSITCTQKPITELSYINLHRGIIDQFLGVGDVILSNPQDQSRTSRSRNLLAQGLTICDIPDYQEVYTLIKDLAQHPR